MSKALKKLVDYRDQNGFTNDQLASVLGLKERIIYYYLNRTIEIPERVEKMVDALNRAAKK